MAVALFVHRTHCSLAIQLDPKRQRLNAVPKARVPTCLKMLKIATRGFTCSRCGLVFGGPILNFSRLVNCWASRASAFGKSTRGSQAEWHHSSTNGPGATRPERRSTRIDRLRTKLRLPPMRRRSQLHFAVLARRSPRNVWHRSPRREW